MSSAEVPGAVRTPFPSSLPVLISPFFTSLSAAVDVVIGLVDIEWQLLVVEVGVIGAERDREDVTSLVDIHTSFVPLSFTSISIQIPSLTVVRPAMIAT